MKKKRTHVDLQNLKETAGNENAYERFTSEHGESELGNPDLLPEQPSGPTNPQLLMGEAIEHLQGRQKEVYISVMREDKSLAETAEILDITKASVQVYLNRAVKFIADYCKQGIERGRV